MPESLRKRGTRPAPGAPLPHSGVLQVVPDRRDQLTVAGVPRELPEERSGEALLLHVGHLSGDGRRRVVAVPVVSALGVRRAADGAGRRAGVLEDLVVLDALLVGTRRRAGRRPAGAGLGDAGPAAAVEADAEQHLVGRYALALQLLDRRVGVEAGFRDAAVRGQRRVRGGRSLRAERAEVVVRHREDQVQLLDAGRVVGYVELAAVRPVRGDRRRDQEAVAELVAQRGDHVVLRGRAARVALQAAGVGVLPVDVDAVEYVGPTGVLDQVVAGVREPGRVRRGLCETAGPGPAAERPDHLDMGVLLLELAQLVERAAQRAGVPGVGDAVDAVGGRVRHVVVGVGVTDRAPAAAGVTERVQQVSELRRGARRDEVLHEVLPLVDAPFGEVADHVLAAGAGRRCGGPGRRRRGRRRGRGRVAAAAAAV